MLGYPVQIVGALGQDEGVSIDIMKDIRRKVADKVGRRWLTRGIIGVLAGTTVTTGAGYLAFRRAGAPSPGQGAIVIGATTFLLGTLALWYTDKVGRDMIVNPPTDDADEMLNAVGKAALATNFALTAF